MKIAMYELYKLFKKRLLVVMLVLLSFLNFYLLHNQTVTPWFSDSAYVRIYDDLSRIEGNENKLAYIEDKIIEYNIYGQLYQGSQPIIDYYADIDKEKLENYIEKFNSGDYVIYNTYAIYDVNNPFWEKLIYEEVYNDIVDAVNYAEYLEGLEANAEAMKGSFLFSKPDSFAYKNIQLTPAAYSHLKGVTPIVDINTGIMRITENVVGDVIAIILILVAVLTLFLDEKEGGLFTLVRPTKNGYGALMRGKLIALFIWSVIITVLFVLGGLLLMSQKYRLGDLSRPIQSVFTGSILNISVLQYLLLFAAAKIISYFIITMIIMIVCTLAKNSVAAYLGAGILLGLQILFYILIEPFSMFGILKYVNIITLTQPNRIFETYLNINFFNEPINVLLVTGLTAVILIIGLLFCLFLLSKKQVYADFNANALSDFLDKFTRRTVYVNVLRHEAYKLLVLNRGLPVLILLFAIMFYNFSSYSAPYLIDYEVYLKNYIEGYNNSDDPDAFIKSENVRFEQLEQSVIDAGERLARGEITGSDFDLVARNSELQQEAKRAFNTVKERLAYLETLPGGKLVYEKGWNDLFGVRSYYDDMVLVLFILLFVTVIVSPVYAGENESGITKVITATPKGLIWTSRYVVNLITALIICAAVSLPQIVTTLSTYGTWGAGAVIQSLPDFRDFTLNISISGYMVLQYLIRILGTAILALAVQIISLYSRNKTTAFIISLSIFVLPAVIYFVGAEFVGGFGINMLIGGNAFLRGGAGAIVTLIVALALVVSVAVFTLRRFRIKTNS